MVIKSRRMTAFIVYENISAAQACEIEENR
jgi:hypothetical protein